MSTNDNRLTQPLATLAADLPADWRDALAPMLQSEKFAALARHVDARVAAGETVYPADPFHALRITPLSTVRVLILGQDPYHGPGQAQGLAFSVPRGQRRPPSLRNIFQVVAEDCGGNPAAFGNDLSGWAEQGVLLLNTVLTVEDGKPASHAKRGWESLTDLIFQTVATQRTAAFMLWGAHAQAKQVLIPATHGHLVLTANHPSPLSARRPPQPFLGCRHFIQTNEWLTERGDTPIDWAGILVAD